MKIYKLPEKLTISQITTIIKQLSPQLTNTDETHFDLSLVNKIDSAGIAFLAYLKTKYAKTKFINSTTQIDNLCQLYKIQL